MKSDKAIDLNALWTADGGPLTSVALKGTDQVVFTFNAPAQPYFYYVADQTPIVPQHIWSTLNQSKLAHLRGLQARWAPARTRSRTARRRTSSTCATPTTGRASRAIRCRRSQEVDYPAFLSNTPANLYLAQGQAQWGGQYIPNIQSFYIAKDPAHRHILVPAGPQRVAVPQPRQPAAQQLAVRQAIAYAIDKPTGLAAAARAASRSPPTRPASSRRRSRAGTTARSTQPTYDPAKAEQILQGRRLHEGLGRDLPERAAGSRSRSRSRRSAATRTGTRRCR